MHDDEQYPPQQGIPDVKLGRMLKDLAWAKGKDEPARFGCDHGNMLIWSQKGGWDLLFTHDGDFLRGNAARVLWHFSPAVSEELIRGYKLARAAGLLGDGKCNEAAAIYMGGGSCSYSSTLNAIAAGKEKMAALVEVLRAENRKPGGIKST